MPATQISFLDQITGTIAPPDSGPIRAPENASEAHQTLDADARGEVFTRAEVVTFMLDLAGYDEATDLGALRVLEPSAGDGAFAVQVVTRMVRSYLKHGGRQTDAFARLQHGLRAVEVYEKNARHLHTRLAQAALAAGLDEATSERLAAAWIVVGDFLQVRLDGPFDLVVGNPPYVRQESIPESLLALYRQRFATLYNRADLYVLFYERGLQLLSPTGKLVFICSDRWMKCAYGRPLRVMIADQFHLAAFVDMVGTPAFTSEVIAYPAITLITRRITEEKSTLAAFRPSLEPGHLSRLAAAFATGKPSTRLGVHRLDSVAAGTAPWLLDASDTLPLVRALEQRLPIIEEAGCKVGIGVATGCDRVFIGNFEALDVEPERKLRLVMADCIRSGRLAWGGLGLVNPFEPDGTLATPARYPKFARFLGEHETALRRRNVAQRAGEGWYRTIDRVWHDLQSTPKLLIPDIKGEPNVVIDRGQYYPHHNLYWITSEEWSLEELQAVLRSTIARLFVATYCVKMANGFLRFQAQYLRRIRLPRWADVSPDQRAALRAAVSRLDQEAIDQATCDVYGLEAGDIAIVQEFRASHYAARGTQDQATIQEKRPRTPRRPHRWPAPRDIRLESKHSEDMRKVPA
ncbi:MAG TPA: Eco57I restriction-modification methylase domain-containing protein [Opitutaceae bacterium]|nr:Eco57I restriction-modification methylase domain-containing protein [Opitutaceae bacterium]HPG16891.1 Eco57I restriction-modification methylase domain-containing protein [Opitutaceae bacterium]HPO00633.1 Eco57I restriction-modification methylase domain-containing protein [Opitutaceae bacterium]